MKKRYILDTNVLIDDPECVKRFYDNGDNEVILPFQVLMELDGLKRDEKKQHLVRRCVNSILENYEKIRFLKPEPSELKNYNNGDLKIINELLSFELTETFITNDKIFQLLCKNYDIKVDDMKSSIPFESESEIYTGLVGIDEEKPINCFYYDNGKAFYNSNDGVLCMDFNNDPWGVKPLNNYQNFAMQLMLDPSVDLVTIQSQSGYGKSYIALACALQLVLQKLKDDVNGGKKAGLYEKIFIVKPTVEIGSSLGFLPGTLEEKVEPYVRPLVDLLKKLHNKRPANKLWLDPNAINNKFNPRVIEVLPLQYIRGMNIDNAIVLIDECQNVTRHQLRSILTRMGENVKCFITGDTNQVDNIYLNEQNNGLNWAVKLFKGHKNYGHIVLKGERSRGRICDLVLKTRL